MIDQENHNNLCSIFSLSRNNQYSDKPRSSLSQSASINHLQARLRRNGTNQHSSIQHRAFRVALQDIAMQVSKLQFLLPVSSRFFFLSCSNNPGLLPASPSLPAM